MKKFVLNILIIFFLFLLIGCGSENTDKSLTDENNDFLTNENEINTEDNNITTDIPNIPNDVPNDVPSDAPVDIPADTPIEVPAENPVEVPVEVPTIDLGAIEKKIDLALSKIFLNVLSQTSLDLDKTSMDYNIKWYQNDIYYNSYNLAASGTKTLKFEAEITENIVTKRISFIIIITSGKIKSIYQHNLNFYYEFITDANKIGSKLSPSQIVLHNTANSAAAKNEVAYLSNPTNTSSTSFHFAVDDIGIYQAIPLNYSAYHAGNATVNARSIGIEVAKSTLADTAIKDIAIKNSQILISLLQTEYNINLSNVITHRDVTGKNCPHDIIERYGLMRYYQELSSFSLK